MHFNFCQFGKKIRELFQGKPVVLDILARGEVGIALVVVPTDGSQLTKLNTGQTAIGDGNPHHRCQTLQIYAVLQAQRQKLLSGQFTCQETPGLIPKLLYPFLQHLMVIFVVLVHLALTMCLDGKTHRFLRGTGV